MEKHFKIKTCMWPIQPIRDAADSTLEADKTGRIAWVIYKNFKLCSYSLMQPLTGSGLYIIKIIKIKGWFFCYKIDPKMFWIAQMGDQSTKKIVRHKMPSSATILLAENWLLWKISWLLSPTTNAPIIIKTTRMSRKVTKSGLPLFFLYWFS